MVLGADPSFGDSLGALLIGLILMVYLTSMTNSQLGTYVKTTYDHQSIQLIVRRLGFGSRCRKLHSS